MISYDSKTFFIADAIDNATEVLIDRRRWNGVNQRRYDDSISMIPIGWVLNYFEAYAVTFLGFRFR